MWVCFCKKFVFNAKNARTWNKPLQTIYGKKVSIVGYLNPQFQ